MVRSGFSHTRGSICSLPGAAVVGLAAFAATWMLLAPAPVEAPLPVAVVRRPASGDAELEPLISEALRIENLRRLLDEADLAGMEVPSQGGLAEWVRGNLRIEIGEIDRVGKQAVSIRWVGGPDFSGAAQLVNLLARELAEPRPTTDVRSLERQLNQARAESAAAAQALAHSRRQFDAVLAEASAYSQPDALPAPRPAPTPPPESFGHAEWQQSRQQLGELEHQREVLAERLMPQHPEMKALDEKIDVLRSMLNNQPTPAPVVADDVALPVESSLPVAWPPPRELAQVEQFGREVLAAQQRYNTALSAERACWQQLAEAPTGTLAEIEPARETPQLAPSDGAWRRWLLSTVMAMAFGGLAFVFWPGRRQIFTSVEEVRASTRLPVVVVDRVMLN